MYVPYTLLIALCAVLFAVAMWGLGCRRDVERERRNGEHLLACLRACGAVARGELDAVSRAVASSAALMSVLAMRNERDAWRKASDEWQKNAEKMKANLDSSLAQSARLLGLSNEALSVAEAMKAERDAVRACRDRLMRKLAESDRAAGVARQTAESERDAARRDHEALRAIGKNALAHAQIACRSMLPIENEDDRIAHNALCDFIEAMNREQAA